MRRRIWGIFVALAAALGPCGVMPAEEAPLRAEEFLPESAIAAFVVPDLQATRKALAKTRLAEVYAQPEMRAFLQPVLDEMRTIYARLRKENPALPGLPDVEAGLFSGELAAALCVRPGDPRQPLSVLAVLTPKDAEAFKRLLPGNLRDALSAGEPMPLAPAPQGPALVFSGGRLLFGSVRADLEAALGRLKAAEARKLGALAQNAHYQKVRAKIVGASAWFYAAPKRAWDALRQNKRALPKGKAALAEAILNELGLLDVSGVGLGLRFAGREVRLEGFLGFRKPPTDGLFGLLQAPDSLPAEAFRVAEAHAPYVSASHFNWAGLFPLLRRTAAAAGPDFGDAFDGALAFLNNTLAFDLEKDFLANLGGELVTAQTVVDTGAPLTFTPGLVLSIPLQAPRTVASCLDKLGQALKTLPLGKLRQLRLKKLPYKGKTIYYLSSLVLAGPGACCVTGKRLLFGTTVNALRRGLDQLDQPAAGNILSNPSFQQAIARISGKPFDPKALPANFAYAEDRGSGGGTLLLTSLGVLAGTANLALLAEWPGAGKPPGAPNPETVGNPFQKFFERPSGKVTLAVAQSVDLGLWPDQGFFAKHRQPTALISRLGPEGLHLKSELPFPGPSSSGDVNVLALVAGTAIVAAIAIPNLLRSRMAANESAAIAACKTFAVAQDLYRRTDYDGDGVLEYAQAITGAHSLYETQAGKGDLILVDAALARASKSGGYRAPKAGYFFKVLTAQGPDAPGGAKSYLVNGNLTIGYALLAYPVEWDGSGRNTFLINNTGTVYQKDLGPGTRAIAEKMTAYNPGRTWVVSE